MPNRPSHLTVVAEPHVVRPLLRAVSAFTGERFGPLLVRVLNEEVSRLSEQRQQQCRKRQAVA